MKFIKVHRRPLEVTNTLEFKNTHTFAKFVTFIMQCSMHAVIQYFTLLSFCNFNADVLVSFLSCNYHRKWGLNCMICLKNKTKLNQNEKGTAS